MDSNNRVPKISVVIPVYNTYPYIVRCIESLKEQTFKDLEFIFVDDCGSDKSMDKVYEWAAVDSRVVPIRNQKNLGPGESRNRGLEISRGTYINVIDPDDWVAPDFYELLYAKAIESSADIVKGTRITIDEKTQKEKEPRSNLNTLIINSLSKKEPLFLELHYEHQTLLFKKSLLDDEVKYGTSGNAQDTTFLFRLCSKTNAIAIEDRAYYYYLQRKNSATEKYSLKRSRNELLSFTEMIDDILKNRNVDEYTYRYILSRFNTYMPRFIHACENEKITSQDKAQFIQDFKEQIFRLPDYQKLYWLDSRILVFVDLDLAHAEVLNKDISICNSQVKDWIKYILLLDDENRKKASKKLEWLLTSYINGRKKAGTSVTIISKEMLSIGRHLKGIDAKKEYYAILSRILMKFCKSSS